MGGEAISDKTMYTLTVARIKNPLSIYGKLKSYVDEAKNYDEPRVDSDVEPDKITSKTIQLAVPEYTSPRQWLYLNSGIGYGRRHGVSVVITESENEKGQRMSSTERVPLAQWANVHRTERLISIEPLSGYRMAYREDEGHVVYLPPDASDDVLGQTLLQALKRSRFVWPPDEPDLFKVREIYAMLPQLAEGFYASLRL